MDIAKIIGNNLKQSRKDCGLTQKQVGEKLNMTQQQYSRFENGIFELNYTQIVELCGLFNITPNDLFDIN
jgi:transcriptional regulator with XRE-family HTH domain